MDWDAAEAHGVVELKLRPWVGKKMVEYLGEEEPALVDLILTQLRNRTAAAAVEEHLKQVLDDDVVGHARRCGRASEQRRERLARAREPPRVVV